MVQFITKPISKYRDPEGKLKKYACKVPFKHIEIHQDGRISACCYTWLPVWVGNLLTDSIDDIVNNAERLRIQQNMRQGNFSDCNDQCPQLNSLLHDRPTWDIIPIKNLDEELETHPLWIYFCYDVSCNLQCPSCRDKLIVWKPNDENDIYGQRAKQIHLKTKELVERMLQEHKKVNLSITGSGDPFASPLYWEYLLELSSKPIPDNLFITLQTNGVMMTPENLNAIKPIWKNISYVNISIDAASEQTYKVVRKNGNFKKLKKNLEFFDDLVYQKSFSENFNWQTNIVVQKDNFKELKEFVQWQLTYKSKPKIWTNLIAQWYHMSNDKFNDMAVWKEDHADYQLLVKILRDPVFLNPQIKLGNLNSFIK